MNGRERRLMHVEDDALTAELVCAALTPYQGRLRIAHAAEGRSALERLRAAKEAELPELIMMDLHMPVMGGREFLRELRADRRLAPVPVVVFTGLATDEEVADCYRLGANSFVAKPLKLEAFNRALRLIAEFWLDLARLP